MDQPDAKRAQGAARRITVRRGLFLAIALPGLIASLVLMIGSILATERIAGDVVRPLMAATVRETDLRLQRMFAPISDRLLSDYAAIRQGILRADSAGEIKRGLLPGLHVLPQVGSAMIGDETGRQVLIMRYDAAARASPLLQPVVATLPPVRPGGRQYFTREFRADEWGERSEWTLWSDDASEVVQRWELPLPGYNPRERPWYRLAMERFWDVPLDDALAESGRLVSWTEAYALFTTQAPGISAAVAARAPDGRVYVLAYDLLLGEVADFTRAAAPTTRGEVMVLTDDGLLLGPPRRAPASEAGVLSSVVEIASPVWRNGMEQWRAAPAGGRAEFRFHQDGAAWWLAVEPLLIGPDRRIWVAVLLPEADLVPWTHRSRLASVVIALVSVGLAVLLAFWLARRVSRPLAALAAQSARITQLDLSDAPVVRSRFDEIDTLARALPEMRHALRDHIADRERARREIYAREQQVRALAENTPDAVARYSDDMRHLYVNRAFAAATGRRVEDIIGRQIGELNFAADVLEAWQRRVAEVFATGTALTLEVALATPAGERYFETRLIPECGADEAVASVLSLSRDVTERLRAERALRQSEARYRTLIESAIFGIIVYQDGAVRFANQAAARIFGYSDPAQMTDVTSWRDFVDPDQRGSVHTWALEVLEKGIRSDHSGWPVRRPDGVRRWVQVTLARIEWEGRTAIIASLRDVTDLRAATERQTELEAQLRQAQKLEAIGLLAGGVAHDFNNLLQVMGGNTLLALMPECLPADRDVYLHEIDDAVQRAAAMTRQLLAFSRHQPLYREYVDLNVVVTDHVALLQRMLPQNIRLDCQVASEPLFVHADKGQLQQVVMNLCVNARDALPGGGILEIRLAAVMAASSASLSAEKTGGPTTYAELTVADNGQGMDAATAARVFEPFFSTKPRGKGTGLGLAVVYGIVQQHHGNVEVRSQPGVGTQFVVRLPRETAPPVATSGAVSRDAGVTQGTILLAEDDERVRRLAARVLARSGFRVIETADGDEALRTFTTCVDEIDLLFFDVMMPGLSGFEAARRCRRLRADVPVLFASGYAADSVAAEGEVPAGARMLAKPYAAADLLAAIDEVIRRPARQS